MESHQESVQVENNLRQQPFFQDNDEPIGEPQQQALDLCGLVEEEESSKEESDREESSREEGELVISESASQSSESREISREISIDADEESSDDDFILGTEERRLVAVSIEQNSRNSKPFYCHKCHKRYRVISCLNRHLKEDHSGKKYRCTRCRRKFKRQYQAKPQHHACH